ncbi:ABC transporter permease subunit [Variovorax terrae]|uniref:Branched-chain amino acid ABC transporter ATP-binding protein/permease n=1 Tax=Variovorax terrae TaxID=2923278 RepID=A0A9X1W5K4_9BURK|nr:branched-chain amino acid ABC transporter ATP-binding protein/permease [Variovorax terrae]MCJ0766163.1 branched-chain amino acid ABC transporter ATP-binding protein/permease [Variovorax terrae]
MNTDNAATRLAAPSRMNRERVILVAISALAVLLLSTASTYYVGLVAVVGVNAIVVIGLAFLMATGQMSLGHAAFVGLGAYSSALLTIRLGIPVVLAIPMATLLCASVGYVLAKLTLQLKGHYLPLATLAYGMAISVCFVGAIDLTGGASGLTGVKPLSIFGFAFDTRTTAVLIWIVVALLVIGYTRVYRGRVGRAARALKSNRVMVSAFGVDVPATRTRIFVLSAALAGLAGTLYACYMQFLSPSTFSLNASINVLIMAVLGGVAGPLGAILGAAFFTVIELSAQYVIANVLELPGQVETMLFGAILIIMLLKWPNGLLSWARIGERPPLEADPGHAASASHQKRPAASLEADNVTKKFGGLTALSEVSAAIPSGAITGLIGPNGAGKSTLFNVLTHVFPATSGSVTLNGKPLPLTSQEVVRQGIARTFQHVQLVQELDVLQNVLIGGYINGKSGLFSAAFGLDKAEEATLTREALIALKRVGLLDVAHTKVSELPLGSQRLVEVARALMARPSLLLLDEPAAGLRAPEKERLSRLLQSLRDEDGMTVLIVEHDMELVMGCADYLFVLNFGTLLAQGSPTEVQCNPDVINAYLGTEV